MPTLPIRWMAAAWPFIATISRFTRRDGLDQQRVTYSPGVGSYSMVPSFSSDGTHVAFEGQREGQAFSQAYIVRADGIGEATLV